MTAIQQAMLRRRLRSQVGAGMVEYALLVAFIGIVLVGALVALQVGIGDLFQRAADAFP